MLGFLPTPLAKSWAINFFVSCMAHRMRAESSNGIQSDAKSKRFEMLDILVPLMKTVTATDPDTGQEKKVQVLYGFGTAPAFPVDAPKATPCRRSMTT